MGEQKSIGGIWKKQGAKGEFLSGTIEINGEKHNFVAFTNERKTEDKHPSYRIFPPRERF